MLYLYNSATDDLSGAIAKAFGSGPLCREAFIGHLHPYLHRISASRPDPRMMVIGDASGGYALLGGVYGFEVRWFPLVDRAIKRPDANMGPGSLEVLSRSVATDEPPADVVIIRPEAGSRWEFSSQVIPRGWIRKGGLLCIEEEHNAPVLSVEPPGEPMLSIQPRGFHWRRAKRDKVYRLQRAIDVLGRILPFLAVKNKLKIYDSF